MLATFDDVFSFLAMVIPPFSVRSRKGWQVRTETYSFATRRGISCGVLPQLLDGSIDCPRYVSAPHRAFEVPSDQGIEIAAVIGFGPTNFILRLEM
jgi:hypothetical protein